MTKRKRKKKVADTFNTTKLDKKSLSLGKVDEEKIVKQLKENADDSWEFMQPLRSTWDEKEALLICKLKDEISTDEAVESGVFDPRLATIVFERTARVMAQPAKGKAYATSKNDIGKNKLMNLLRDYHYKHASYWRSMLIKERILDLFSLVYGTMFALTAWVIRDDHIGPEMIPWPIRMCWPQPSATSIDECEWFQLGAMKSVEWLKRQPRENKDGTGWRNIDKLIEAMGKKTSGDVKPSEQRSYIEEQYYATSERGSEYFPKVEIRTEYRKDRWYTYAPKYGILLRVMKNPYGEAKNDFYGKLPIIAKDAFPLMDSIIGLGEFERGKTLQYALNSLWNLYLDGVKYSIFPPIHMNPKNVVRSSIKWGAGEKWLMKNPGVDVQMMRMTPQGLQTFQSTYSFLLSAIMNQAGTTDVSKPMRVEPTLGKTPQAIRFMAARESARDEWDRVMMEETIKAREERWIDMIVKKMEKPVIMRIFGPEVEEIAQEYPDVVEFFDKKWGYGSLRISKEKIQAKYDFELETGSTMKKDIEGEQHNISQILGLVLKNPQIIAALREKGKDLDIGELFKRWIIAGGIKDYDRIIVDFQTKQQPGGMPGQPGGGQIPPEALGQMANEIERQAETLSAAQEMVGGVKAIPPMPGGRYG